MPDQNTMHPSSLCKSQRRRVEALLHARAALHGAQGSLTVGQVLGLSQVASGVHADPAELLWLAEFIEGPAPLEPLIETGPSDYSSDYVLIEKEPPLSDEEMTPHGLG